MPGSKSRNGNIPSVADPWAVGPNLHGDARLREAGGEFPQLRPGVWEAEFLEDLAGRVIEDANGVAFVAEINPDGVGGNWDFDGGKGVCLGFHWQ